MKISRAFALKIHFILDQLLPPILRDLKIFMWYPLKIMFSCKTSDIMNFKEKFPYMSYEDYVSTYEVTMPYHVVRETDLNPSCIQAIMRDIIAPSVLEVGCGRGFLARKMNEAGLDVTATDIILPEKESDGKIQFIKADVSALPFENKAFDTVVCTHVLEHVINFKQSVNELRRVAKKRLIIVVPKQRPYRYTFDLHLRFFPYIHSFLLEMYPLRKGSFYCANVGSDIYYVENMDGDQAG